MNHDSCESEPDTAGSATITPLSSTKRLDVSTMALTVASRISSSNLTPAAAVSASQNTAPVHEFRCLFTHDIRRKNAKRWHDGILRFHTFNKRAMVYDHPDKNYVGDSHVRDRDELEDGDEIQLDRGGVLVQVGEKIHTEETDLTGLLVRENRNGQGIKRSDKETPQRPIQSGVMSRPTQGIPRSSVAYPNTPSRVTGRAIVPKKSPFEERSSIPLAEMREHGPPAKRRRNDENHVPLWEVLRTSKMPKSKPQVTSKATTTLQPKISLPRQSIPSLRRNVDGQAKLKVKELIVLDLSLPECTEERPMSNEEEVEMHSEPVCLPSTSVLLPSTIVHQQHIMPDNSMVGQLVKVAQESRSKEPVDTVPAITYTASNVGADARPFLNDNLDTSPGTVKRTLKEKLVRAKPFAGSVDRSQNHNYNFKDITNTELPDQQEDCGKGGLSTTTPKKNDDSVDRHKSANVSTRPAGNLNEGPCRPLQLATAPRRKMLLCEAIPARKPPRRSEMCEQVDTTPPKPAAGVQDLTAGQPNKMAPPTGSHTKDAITVLSGDSDEVFEPPTRAESRSHPSCSELAQTENQISKNEQSESRTRPNKLPIIAAMAVKPSSLRTLQHFHHPRRTEIQQIVAPEPTIPPAITERTAPRQNTTTASGQAATAQLENDAICEANLPSPIPLSKSGSSDSPIEEVFSVDTFATSGPWTIEAWDLFGWLPPGKKFLRGVATGCES